MASATCLCKVLITSIIIHAACWTSLSAAAAQSVVSTTTISDVTRLNALLWTRPPCRLMARNPYLSSRVREMSADDVVHLIEYKLQFPDGFTDNITGTTRVSVYEPYVRIVTVKTMGDVKFR